MKRWLDEFHYDPISALLDAGDESLAVFVRRDLLGEHVCIKDLWLTKEARRIVRKQNPDGSWTYPQPKESIRSVENYNQIETYQTLGVLVEEFGFTRAHPAIRKAANYLFSFQTRDGDFRGIYGNQYTPNYSAGIAELLIKAGYGKDPRVRKAFRWLLTIRQHDGGWAIPLRTTGRKLDAISLGQETVEPNRDKASSHMVTGVVLRAFAAHPGYRRSAAAHQAGALLVRSLFRKDRYPDRGGADYWLKFSFPFWFTDLISALDTLSWLGFSQNEPGIEQGLAWFRNTQQPSGLWKLRILKGKNRDVLELWLALAISRIFKRFYDLR